MSKKITISVPDELHAKMVKWKESFKFSKVFQNAISKEIEKKERFHSALKEEKSMQDIWNAGNFETSEGQYHTGKEFGFAYAKSLRYHELKPYEQYIEGWNERDPETIDGLLYDLDIMSIFDRMGLVEKAENISVNEAFYLENSFDMGFVTGVMEFIQEECSQVEVGKIIIERDKKMALTKDKDEKWKIFEEYRDKTKPILDINENN